MEETINFWIYSQPHRFSGSSSCGENIPIERRRMLISSAGLLAEALLNASMDGVVVAAEFIDMPALRGKDYGKAEMRYPDYTETESDLQYENVGLATRKRPYTKDFFKTVVGDDKAFCRFRLGSKEVIPAFEEAVSGTALGGVRRIIVPPELGYPENDFNKSRPRPTKFSDQFVLRNQGLIDKTLLFDFELLKIMPN